MTPGEPTSTPTNAGSNGSRRRVLTFGALLRLENALALYYYVLDPTLSAWYATAVPPVVWQATMAAHVVELLAIAAVSI